MSGASKKRRVERAQDDRRRHHLAVREPARLGASVLEAMKVPPRPGSIVWRRKGVDLAGDKDDDNLQDDLTSNASSNTHALPHKR